MKKGIKVGKWRGGERMCRELCFRQIKGTEQMTVSEGKSAEDHRIKKGPSISFSLVSKS